MGGVDLRAPPTLRGLLTNLGPLKLEKPGDDARWSPKALAAELRRACETSLPASPRSAVEAVMTPRGLELVDMSNCQDIPVPVTPRGEADSQTPRTPSTPRRR
mmetsp:Transcript_40237/g.125389  ORF Transcript_40237/g.125389 Transcript_40237/m.125389 type:complete len:103 (+) Transcript_40237:49-357(+)